MALPLSNSFDGGSNGTPISTGNSGGASGDAFDGVSGTTAEYDSDVADAIANGSMCLKIPAPANTIVSVNWSSYTAPMTIYGRFYVYRTTTPAEQQRLLRWYESLGGAEGGRLSWHTDGKLYWVNNLGSPQAAASFTLPTSTLIRIEFKIVAGPTGSGEARVFLGHSTSQVSGSPYIVASFNTSPNSLGIGDMRFGNCVSASPGDTWIDALNLNSTDYPGPVSTLTLDSCLPDADITTAGWSTAPLFSKVNDASDATVIQATAS